jgi:hypothetical protein
MAQVSVIIERPSAADSEITFVDNVDDLAGTDKMFGCGNDNPFQ